MRAAYVKKEINKEIPADSHHMAHARDVLNVRDQVLLEQEHRMASQDQQNVILKTQDVEWENATAGHLWEPPTRTTTDVPAETKKAAPWVDLAPDEEPAPLAGIEIKDELPSEPNEAGAWEQHVLPKPAEPREEIFLQTEPAQAWEEAFSLHDLEVDQSSSGGFAYHSSVHAVLIVRSIRHTSPDRRLTFIHATIAFGPRRITGQRGIIKSVTSPQ